MNKEWQKLAVKEIQDIVKKYKEPLFITYPSGIAIVESSLYEAFKVELYKDMGLNHETALWLSQKTIEEVEELKRLQMIEFHKKELERLTKIKE